MFYFILFCFIYSGEVVKQSSSPVWCIFNWFFIDCVLLGENLVPEPQGQGEEVDQEEAGPVWRQRRLCAQWPRFGEPSAGAGLRQPLGHARLSVPPSSGNEHLAIYQEYTASDCDSVRHSTVWSVQHNRALLRHAVRTLDGQPEDLSSWSTKLWIKDFIYRFIF